MKTTKRSKMLLSSIAMLLVALVALGSASFAWYYTNTSVSASTTKLQASTSEGLEISHNKTSWGTTVTDLVGYDGAKVLTPASYNYGTFAAGDTTTDDTMIGATGQSGAYDSADLSGALTDVAVANGSYFLVDTFYVASSSSSSQTATFTITGEEIADSYLNVAVYIGNSLEAVYTTDDATTTRKITKTNGTYGSTTGQTLVPFTGSAQTVTASFSAAPKGDGNGGTAVHIVAFADGFNENCKSSTVNTEDLAVTFNFSTTT